MNVQPTSFAELTAMKKIKRIIVAIVGGTVLVFGVALIVLPGPAFIVIPAGLAILAMEFAWARRWLRKAVENLKRQILTRQTKRRVNGKSNLQLGKTPSRSSSVPAGHRA